MTITVSKTVSMGHRLPSYKGLCSSPHGHNMKIEVEVRQLTAEMLDFKAVSSILDEQVEPFDHAMLLQESDHLVPFLRDFGFRVFTFPEEPTTETVAAYIGSTMDKIGSVIRAWKVVRCTVYETDKYSAVWRP